jgi:4-hydroxy-3-polyprenylbenzoate decarboxylase
VLNNLDAQHDVVMMPGPVDDLDHGSYTPALGVKVGVDATRKSAAEGYTREWPPDMVMDQAVRERVTRRWNVYGLDRIERSLQGDAWSGQGPEALRRLLRRK